MIYQILAIKFQQLQQQICKQIIQYTDYIMKNYDNSQIPPYEYVQTLKFMQAVDQQSYDRAYQIMKSYDFNLQTAISSRHRQNNNYYKYQDMKYKQFQNSSLKYQLKNENQIKKKRQSNNKKRGKNKQKYKFPVFNLINWISSEIKKILKKIITILLPKYVINYLFCSPFYKLYRPLVGRQFQDISLRDYLSNNQYKKPLIFFISSPHHIHQCFHKLFRNQAIKNKIKSNFTFSGICTNDPQYLYIQGQKQPPSVFVCRKNIQQQLEVTKKFNSQAAILQINTQKLDSALKYCQQAKRRDNNIENKQQHKYNKIQFPKFPNRQYLPKFLSKQSFNYSDKYEQTSQKSTQTTQLIRNQNMEYHQMQKQDEIKKRKQKLQQQQLIKKQQQRKIKRMTIPQQPQEGDIIRINFRFPNGKVQTRNFDSNQKLQLIYRWVQTNADIQFQDNSKRPFQLKYGFPPVSLQNKRDSKLKDIFQSDQEKIIINQL